ncbi:MAG: sulfide/dihydroorotate dehydrogenase-like FAD/NAD-binding protein [Candidatus Odinarchaeota archaeon]
MTIWDIIIVGGGPAGLSCAIRSAELGLNVLVLESRSEAATTAAGNVQVDDYPGFFSITRQELLQKMIQHAETANVAIKYAHEVVRLEVHGDVKRVVTKVQKGELFTEQPFYEGKTVVIATGLHPDVIGIPGEKRFKDKGVYYRPPAGDYAKKNVVIVGHTTWAIRNAMHYDSIGAANISLVTKKEKLDTHPVLLRRLNESFVKILENHTITQFLGKDHISSTHLRNSKGETTELPTDLVIILAGKSANSKLFIEAGLAIDPNGRIIVGSKQETNFPGVFAIGSATRDDAVVGVGAAEGIKVAENAIRYLEEKEKEETEKTDEVLAEDKLPVVRFVEGRSIIIEKEDISSEIIRWVVHAPQIAKKVQPGQFVILRVNEKGERIPLTVAEFDREKGTITLIFQKIGKSTELMGTMKAGDHILNLLGPLGQPVEIHKYGTVAVLGGGCGVAPVLPKTWALKEVGNHVIGIISARTTSLLICREEMREACHELYIATDDGTEGHHGFGLDILVKMIEEGRKIDHVVAVGPIPMMRATVGVTKKHGIPTTVSLAPLMVDGTGMCGACRVTLRDERGSEVKFACVDGPNFDGLRVDFEELALRSRAYLYEERITSERSRLTY